MESKLVVDRGWGQGLGRVEDGRRLPVGTGFPSGAMEAFWNEIVVTVSQRCE